MGVDHYIHRACRAQSASTPDAFLEAMRGRRLQSSMSGSITIREADGSRRSVTVAPSPQPVPLTTVSADGTTRTGPIPSSDLDAYAPDCVGCPANREGTPFGCYGYVAYPIEAATEEWLLRRATANVLDAGIAANILHQVGVLGQKAAALRASNVASFFEARAPKGVQFVTTDGKPILLTTDMLFEMLVLVAPQSPRLIPVAFALLDLLPAGAGLAQRMGKLDSVVTDADVERLAPETAQQAGLARLVWSLRTAYVQRFAIVSSA